MRSYKLFRLLSTSPALQQYESALNLITQKNYPEACESLSQVLTQLKSEKQYGTQIYAEIQLRQANLHRVLQDPAEAEAVLEEIVDHSRARGKSAYQKAQSDLFLQYLNSNVDKAVELGKELLSQPDIDREELKNLLFYQACALTLQGKHIFKAKAMFQQVLDMNPQENTCYVLHNLAVAQFMHFLEANEGHATFEAISYEYSLAIPNFLSAIAHFEGKEDFSLYKINHLENKFSGLSLLNIAEICMQEGKTEDALRCLRQAYSLYSSHGKEGLPRTLTLQAVLLAASGDSGSAKKMLETALKAQGAQDGNLLALYHVCGEVLGEEYKGKAEELEAELPYWARTAVHMHLPVWTVL